ncbi:MAG TPA: ATP-dependent DNA helicase RecG [Solirubrobacteraceae bacterium]|nr:ATP-dependent DNA helicase RecG [Solirubrobacteraceae bacterium]
MSAAGTATAPSSRDRLEIGRRAFASTAVLDWMEMLGAPVRWPRPSRLNDPLDVPPGKLADGLETLRLTSVGALLEHLPRDSREARTVAALKEGEQATVAVRVRRIGTRAVRRRGMKPLVEATVFDATGTMRATFFNQPWLAQRYEPGTRLVLHGKTTARGTFNVAHHAVGGDLSAQPPSDPSGHPIPGEAQTSGEIAHYPATEGASSTQILALVQGVRGALTHVPEPLSAATRVSEGLPDRRSALAAMHFPHTAEDRETGRGRLAFDELLLTQLVFLRRRARRRASANAHRLSESPSLSERWLRDGLPFVLTGDQLRSVETIGEELASGRPMQRLLMGEVGSGKTVVALYTMLRAVEHGMQAALMAPTETLAEQHFATVQRLIGGESVPAALLTGSTPARRRQDILGKLASGELGLVVGTHALIEPDVRFRALAVAVVDEQHRFGVRQRAALDGKGAIAAGGERPIGDRPAPHVLHMTATPIPRTLALARYGDLDVSVLRELPKGRQAIETRIVAGESARAGAYEELREQLSAGRQAYVVCPLVEETPPPEASDPGPSVANERTPAETGPSTDLGALARGVTGEVRAAKAEYERLAKGELKGYELVLLHGGMRPREKQEAMARFASGKADVLVATTVIEVGVDVANATVMLVENAERFGLSQLHQLRGRVGRGEHRSTCMLVGPPAARRLRAMVEHSDGFRLAEIDLELRSEGELVGTRQSGLSQFTVACLPEDAALLERARARAEAILASDPELQGPEHALLGEVLAQAFGAEALEPIPA